MGTTQIEFERNQVTATQVEFLREIGYSTQVEFKWALINPIIILVVEHWSGLKEIQVKESKKES